MAFVKIVELAVLKTFEELFSVHLLELKKFLINLGVILVNHILKEFVANSSNSASCTTSYKCE